MLFNGEYFEQNVTWHGLRAGSPAAIKSAGGIYSAEALALLERDGPKYQYGSGCLSDGVLGLWLAELAGVETGVDPAKIASHLAAVYRYNFKADLRNHANPQRPGYALGNEGGLLLCSWPRGGKPALPFVYSDEVWTGVEYQAACHLIMTGQAQEGLKIVRACRARYDGRCAQSVQRIRVRPLVCPARLRPTACLRHFQVPAMMASITCSISARGCPATLSRSSPSGPCYGTVGVRNGDAFFKPVSGSLGKFRIAYTPYAEAPSN